MESFDRRPVQWRLAARVLEAGLIDLGLMPNGRCFPA